MSDSRRPKRTPRPYIKIDTSIGDHRRSLELDEQLYLGCIGLFVLGLCHSDRLRTDGFVSKKVLRRLAPGTQHYADELARVGFWDERDDGYQVPHYARWQDTADEIAAKSEHARKAVGSRKDRQSDSDTECSTECRTDCFTPRPTDAIPPSEPNPDDPPELQLSKAAAGKLNVLRAGDLLQTYGFANVLRAIETTLANEAKGESIRAWGRYVESVCRQQIKELGGAE